MRIISKFKDYYDSALAYGRDESLVYVREEELIPYVHPTDQKKHPETFARIEGVPYVGRDKPEVNIRPEYRIPYDIRNDVKRSATIAFCGKVYPWYAVKVKTPEGQLNYDNGIWIDSFDKRFDEYVTLSRNWRQMSANEREWESWAEWFAENSGYEDARLNLHFNSPIVIYQGSSWLINAQLTNFNFQRIVDPYTAFQELSMFVGGVLGSNAALPEIQTDKQKVLSHGFDPKYGFRTPPKVSK